MSAGWMRISDLERELRRAGFGKAQLRGSHRHYRHLQTGRRITFSPYHRAGADGEVGPHTVARVRREIAACSARASGR